MRDTPASSVTSSANEISSTMVRWYGVRRVTEFVENMINIGRDADDDVLFSYASYPPTEYLLPQNIGLFHIQCLPASTGATSTDTSPGSKIWPKIAR